MGASTWTEFETEILKELWCKGVSASEISKTLETKSRNSVIGKAHRLCLEQRSVKKPRKPDKPLEGHVKSFQQGQIALKDVKPNQCRFMGGGISDFSCCGKEPVYKFSMCEEHYKQCIEKNQPKPMKIPKRQKSGHLFVEI